MHTVLPGGASQCEVRVVAISFHDIVWCQTCTDESYSAYGTRLREDHFATHPSNPANLKIRYVRVEQYPTLLKRSYAPVQTGRVVSMLSVHDHFPLDLGSSAYCSTMLSFCKRHARFLYPFQTHILRPWV